MLFNSLEFILFLPIVFLLYWFVFNRKLYLQNFFVVVVSYIFYGWWSPSFLILIFIATLCSYVSGLIIYNSESLIIKKLVTIANIFLNLGFLGVYKYYDFFIENLLVAFKAFDISVNIYSLNLILPIGISFYTFQTLSYTIDVYRKDIKATSDVVSFFAYVSFFPQLVAGPIERAANIIPQFQKQRNFKYVDAVEGLRQMLWGFFKKVVIADNCAPMVSQIFDNYQEQSSGGLLLGGFYFTMQIYGDFSGYSDIALGIAKLFGIKLMNNFDRPYFSRNIAEFWRKWHISLMTWFRDYIYFPLGGSRGSKLKTIRNTFIVFGISGLWHGANWTFIVWGLYHASLFVPKLIFGTKSSSRISNRWTFRDYSKMCMTFFMVLLGWIIFRSDDLKQAIGYIQRMFSFDCLGFNSVESVFSIKIIFFIIIMLVGDWLFRNRKFTLSISGVSDSFLYKYVKFRWVIYYSVALMIYFFAGSQSEFIYFQF